MKKTKVKAKSLGWVYVSMHDQMGEDTYKWVQIFDTDPLTYDNEDTFLDKYAKEMNDGNLGSPYSASVYHADNWDEMSVRLSNKLAKEKKNKKLYDGIGG